MNKVYAPLLKTGIVFVLSLQLIILTGLSIQGYFNTSRALFTTDRVFGLAFLVIGLIFAIITMRSIFTVLKSSQQLIRWRQNKTQLLIAGGIFIILIIIQPYFFSGILYAGLLISEFVISQARLGYLKLTPIDIYHYQVTYLAWLGQLYFIYTIAGWIYGFKKKQFKSGSS
jgi:hypothetical protein